MAASDDRNPRSRTGLSLFVFAWLQPLQTCPFGRIFSFGNTSTPSHFGISSFPYYDMSWVTHCRTATAALRVNRSFSTSSAVAFPRARKRSETRDVDEFNDADLDPGEPMDEMGIMLEELQSHQDEGTREGEDDTTSAGHLMIMRQREKLTYMRLIDHEMPQLVGMFVLFSWSCLGTYNVLLS